MRRASRIVTLAVLLTAIWYLLSGKFDLLHFGTGVVVAFLIAANYVPVEDRASFRVVRFLGYVPWLIGQILLSNLRVAQVVLTKRMPIAPAFISVPPGVSGPRALTLLGCSITLTPGTLSVDVGDDEVFVHALESASAQDIRDTLMARRVAEVFPEGPRP